MNISSNNVDYLRTILEEIGYPSYIKVKASYVNYNDKKIDYFLSLDSDGILYDNIDYGKVRSSSGYNKKIYDFASSNNILDKMFFIEENMLQKIRPSVKFLVNTEVQEKLFKHYLEKIKKQNNLDKYTFLLKFPGISLSSLNCSSNNIFYTKYKEELNELGLSAISLFNRFKDLIYLPTDFERKKYLWNFFNSSELQGSTLCFNSDKDTHDNNLKYLIKDFINVVSNKIDKEDILEPWLLLTNEHFLIILKTFSSKIFEMYRQDKDFASEINNIKASGLLNVENTEAVEKMGLNSSVEKKYIPFFKEDNNKNIEYIVIENQYFFENIPTSLVSFFNSNMNLNKLFKSSIENATNVVLSNIITSSYPSVEKDKKMILIIESDSKIDKEKIKDIIVKTLLKAVQCSSPLDIKNSNESISIAVFQEILEQDTASVSNKKSQLAKF